MNEDRLRGPIPAYEMLSVGFAAGAMQVLGNSRPESRFEGLNNRWKTSDKKGSIHQIILGIWSVTHSWFLQSTDGNDVRAVAELYYLLQGRPGEEFAPACSRLLGVIERCGADIVVPRLTTGGHKYYEVRPNQSLAWVISESEIAHGPRARCFAQDVADRVRDLRRVVVNQEEVSKSWHDERIVA